MTKDETTKKVIIEFIAFLGHRMTRMEMMMTKEEKMNLWSQVGSFADDFINEEDTVVATFMKGKIPSYRDMSLEAINEDLGLNFFKK